MDPSERRRTASRRLAEPFESLAQNIARHVIELVVEALDFNALIDQIELNRVVDQVDLNRALDKVDVNRLLEKVDVNKLLDQVDVDRLVARVDVQAVLRQVDVNELANQVDINALVERAGIEEIVARSSSSIASQGVNLVRSQAVGLDDFFARWVNRLRRRGYAGPPILPGLQAEPGLQGEQ
jgi:hypothetical protein